MVVRTPDCRKDLDVDETFIVIVTRHSTLRVTSIELGLRRADDDAELSDMYGWLCWQGCDSDQRGFKKLMWYEIM